MKGIGHNRRMRLHIALYAIVLGLATTLCSLPRVENVDQPSGEPYWIVAVGGQGRDYAPSFTSTVDGYVVVGMTSSYGLGDGGGNLDGSHDFLAVKLDKFGHLVWSRTIGGPEDERGSYSVNPTSDGGFLLTGTTRSYGAGKTDIFVVKLSASGNLDWSLAIGGTGSEAGMSTLETGDGYLTLGDTDSFGAGKKDLLVVKLKPNGEIAWAKAIGGREDEVGSGVAPLEGGYVIGGTVWSFGAGEADAGLIMLDKAGNVLWGETIGGVAAEGINWDGVRVTSDGGFAFGDKTASFGAQGNGALFGVKLKPDGSLDWGTMVDGPGEDVGWTMNETDDGFIAGGKVTIPPNGGDILFVKFDPQGSYLWSRYFGADGLDEIEEIKASGEGYVMAGVTRMVDPAGDFLVAKVNLDGVVGGDSDPISPLAPRSVVSIMPQISAFSPKVSDGSSSISVQSISPLVTSPIIQIHQICFAE